MDSESLSLEKEAPWHFTILKFAPSHVMSTEGAELADTSAARVEAARRIGELLTNHAGQLWEDQDWQMDVTDDNGLILYVVHVTAMKTPATQNT